MFVPQLYLNYVGLLTFCRFAIRMSRRRVLMFTPSEIASASCGHVRYALYSFHGQTDCCCCGFKEGEACCSRAAATVCQLCQDRGHLRCQTNPRTIPSRPCPSLSSVTSPAATGARSAGRSAGAPVSPVE